MVRSWPLPVVFAALTSIGALALAAPPQQPAPDGPAVVEVEPAPGSTISRRLTVSVRARITGNGAITAEVVEPKRPGDEEKAHTMRLLEDGRYGADDVPLRDGLVVRARDGDGKETSVELRLVDGTGHDGRMSVMASGWDAPTLEVRDVTGAAVEVGPKSGAPTLVLFYGTWDDCEQELEWLEQTRQRYAARNLSIVGVASVALDDVEAWRRYLEERRVAWPNVADTDGAIASAWRFPARRTIGNAASQAAVYLVKDRKIMAGDTYAPAHLLESQDYLSTQEALKYYQW